MRPAADLAAEEVFDCLLHHLTAGVRDLRGEWNVLGADLYAVLREAALLDAAIAHKRPQPFVFERLTGRMLVEQAYLGDRRRAYEPGLLVELGASLHAATARDAA